MARILSAVAQAERERILERTNERRLEAITCGVRLERKPTVDRNRIQELYRVTEISPASVNTTRVHLFA